MRFDVLTIFPGMFDAYVGESIMKRAQKHRLVSFHFHDLRDFTDDKRRTVDDRPYGGGPGMLMKIEPIVKTLEKILGKAADKKRRPKMTKVYAMDPGGLQFSQSVARKMTKLKRVVLICGRYEGIDARIDSWIDGKISVGPYVLTGGEIPAMVVVDVVSRLVPGVLGHADSSKDETDVEKGYVEYPQYTRPEVFRKKRVPRILLSGDHERIMEWRTPVTGKH